ncbi:hypothetical protein FRB91_005972 [Serendipita sp. 411]|nr:hypothetical protein FRB91_005972 [Serendipita sp. 411]
MVISYMNSSLSPPHGTSNSSAPSAQYGTSIPSQPSTRSMPPGRQNWSQYPGQINRSTTPEPQPPPVNDGKPTTRPIPGHPLLSRGRVLIYPPGYECHKCYNKGFRPVHASTFDPTPRALAPGDPSHPCLKCWRTYSHPYNAEIAQLDWNDVVTANRQRPISEALQGQPRNGPPQVSSPGPSMQPQFTGSPPPRSSPFGGPSSPRSRGRGSGFGGGFPGVIVVQTSGRGGGGRTTFTPGDARIGGRRCVKCDGTGRIRVFILESERCNMCGGLGRVFYKVVFNPLC